MYICEHTQNQIIFSMFHHIKSFLFVFNYCDVFHFSHGNGFYRVTWNKEDIYWKSGDFDTHTSFFQNRQYTKDGCIF